MILLCIDPGLTTGWAVFRNGVPMTCGDIHVDDLEEGIEMWKEFSPEKVLAEMVAPRGVNKHAVALDQVMGKIRESFPEAEWIRPGQWKPISQTWDLPEPVGGKYSPHQKDALRMGLWLLHREEINRKTQG